MAKQIKLRRDQQRRRQQEEGAGSGNELENKENEEAIEKQGRQDFFQIGARDRTGEHFRDADGCCVRLFSADAAASPGECKKRALNSSCVVLNVFAG